MASSISSLLSILSSPLLISSPHLLLISSSSSPPLRGRREGTRHILLFLLPFAFSFWIRVGGEGQHGNALKRKFGLLKKGELEGHLRSRRGQEGGERERGGLHVSL